MVDGEDGSGGVFGFAVAAMLQRRGREHRVERGVVMPKVWTKLLVLHRWWGNSGGEPWIPVAKKAKCGEERRREDEHRGGG